MVRAIGSRAIASAVVLRLVGHDGLPAQRRQGGWEALDRHEAAAAQRLGEARQPGEAHEPRVRRAAGSGKVRLLLRARDASRVAATYVKVDGKRTAYRKPLLLPAKRLAKLRYGSVDVWGNAEAARKAPRPGR